MRHLRLPLMQVHPQTEQERETRKAASARWLVSPSVAVLLLWMAIPLAMTIWFSFSRYNLLNPDLKGFAGFDNYKFLAGDPSFGKTKTDILSNGMTSYTRLAMRTSPASRSVVLMSVCAKVASGMES